MNQSKERCALETAKKWASINWENIKQRVKSLQLRIAKATREGRRHKVKALQWLLTHSWAAKVLAVKRVTENKGKRTAGVDGVLWSTLKAKLQGALSLNRKDYKSSPLRRIYIAKKDGKQRPIGIPTFTDRAFQALHLLALEPIAETLADKGSYGFRIKRGCHDAIERCYIHLSRKDSASWILEGDIKGCFDNISHQWLMDNIPTDKKILKQWLKAGVVDKKILQHTDKGTPQGGIISPTLSNMTLDGLEKKIDERFDITIRPDGCRGNNLHKIHLIRYADDFIVTASNKEILIEVVKPLIEDFLAKRGLQLSQEKTKITHVKEGFEFLGQTIRRVPNGKLIITPSKDSVKSVVSKIKFMINKHRGNKTAVLIRNLNPIITGWTNYHRHVCSKRCFSKLESIIWRNVWNWARKRHNNLGYYKIVKMYFNKIGNRNWQFFGTFSNGKTILLRNAAKTLIVRYKLINGAANPYNPVWNMYFINREKCKFVA